jgi:phage terminase large subunit GpA-like protein
MKTIEKDLDFIFSKIEAISDEKEILKVSEWAELNRYLTQDITPMFGHWDNSITPYAVEIMDNMSVSSPVKTIIWMKGAQIGFNTSVIENAIGYIIDHAPAPTMYVSADKEMAEMSIELKIDKMIKTSNLGNKIFSQAKDNDKFNRKTGDTKVKKEFAGGFLLAVGAKSPSKLRQVSIKNLFLDEVDGYPLTVGKEGDPVSLAMRRTNAYPLNKKILAGSTPTILQTSRINKMYLKGDQRKYHVPCKDCGHFQELKFEPNSEGKGGIVFSKDDDGNLIKDSVHYACENCGSAWKNVDKINFLPNGKWVPTKKSFDSTYRSYHLNSLYSPVGMYSWEEVVQDFLEAKKDVLKLQAFINTVLGLPWDERAERVDSRRIMRNKLEYLKGKIPKEVLFLTLGADVHKNRIDVEIVGWARKQVSYSIDWLSIVGDTESVEGEAWEKLEELIQGGIDGRKISLSLIDSGYLADQVYSFCSRFGSGVYPLKGVPYNQKLAHKYSTKLVDVKGYGELQCLNVYVDFYKNRLESILKFKLRQDGQPPWGFCFYPTDYPDSYFKQYENEEKKELVDKLGHRIGYVWERRGNAPNHAWDCRIYNMAAFDLLLELVRNWQDYNFTISEFFDFIAENPGK